MNESRPTLEDEAKALNDALYAILYWDKENVIPDELHEQARAALRPQFAASAVNAEMASALEKIAAWRFDVRSDCVADAQLLARHALGKPRFTI
jgi:hypothetical protein